MNRIRWDNGYGYVGKEIMFTVIQEGSVFANPYMGEKYIAEFHWAHIGTGMCSTRKEMEDAAERVLIDWMARAGLNFEIPFGTCTCGPPYWDSVSQQWWQAYYMGEGSRNNPSNWTTLCLAEDPMKSTIKKYFKEFMEEFYAEMCKNIGGKKS